MAPPYVESVWWSLKQCSTRACSSRTTASPRTAHGTRRRCPTTKWRRATRTTSTLGVRAVPADRGPWQGANLLVWTTTPWTLPSNTAVAVHPERLRTGGARGRSDGRGGRRCLPARAAGSTAYRTASSPAALRTTAGSGAAQRFGDEAFQVFTADYVTMDSGTGIVHLAPAFGAEDMAVGRRTACRWSTRSASTATSSTTSRSSAACSSVTPTHRHRRAHRGGPAGQARAVPAQLSALLALRHGADLLRAAVLVHPHHRRSRTGWSRRTSAPTGIPSTSSTAATGPG